MALGVIGLITGSVAGWVSLIAVDGPEAITALELKIYLVLVCLLPILLWLMNFALEPEDREKYTSLGSALLLMLIASIIGSVVGSILFLVTGTNIPAAFGGEDPIALSAALKQQIWWEKFTIVSGITISSALSIGVWMHQSVKAETET